MEDYALFFALLKIDVPYSAPTGPSSARMRFRCSRDDITNRSVAIGRKRTGAVNLVP